MTLVGIDISYAQATTPSLVGQSFVFCRASYRNYVDSRWVQHAGAVRAAGKVLGAYHFLYLTPSVENQVATFLATAQHADLLVLDVEGEVNSTAGFDMARQFIAQVHAAGRRIGLYHSASGFTDLGQDFDWIAKWSSTPPAAHWDFWQYGTTVIGGHSIDGDKFAGDATALAALVGGTQGGSAGGIDIVGLSLTLPAAVIAGSLAIPLGCDSIRVSDAAHYKVPSAVSRPAYVASLTGATTEEGYLVDLDGDTLHFIRKSDAGAFTPTPLTTVIGHTDAELAAAKVAGEQHEWDREFTGTAGAKITPLARP